MENYNVGLIGAGFMAKAHALAFAGIPLYFPDAPARAIKKKLADINMDLAEKAAFNFEFEQATDNWKEIIEDPEIDIVDICTPNYLHHEIALAAAKAGKHILCEKPLASTIEDAQEMYEAVKKAGVKNMTAYNYRRVPAIMLAKQYIEDGVIGKILNVRGTYYQSWSADPSGPLSWRFQKKLCGAGALGDIGTHAIDLTRYLIGDYDEVCSMTSTFIKERPVQEGLLDNLGKGGGEAAQKKAVDVDDFAGFLIKFKNGALGNLEASRNGLGRYNYITLEIYGTEGTISFDYERFNELKLFLKSDPDNMSGFRTIYQSAAHPYGANFWPVPALSLGYAEMKIIEAYDFINAIATDTEIKPDFKDGLIVDIIAETILKAAETKKWEKVPGVK